MSSVLAWLGEYLLELIFKWARKWIEGEVRKQRAKAKQGKLDEKQIEKLRAAESKVERIRAASDLLNNRMPVDTGPTEG